MPIREQGIYQVIKAAEDGTPEVLFIPMEKGAMLGSPFWTNSMQCWAAKVKLAPAQPGGLDRSFLKVGTAKEHYFVTAIGFTFGHALEFGAKNSRERSAWVVADSTPTYVVLVKCGSGIAAARLSEKLRANDPTECARVAKLITPEAPTQDTPPPPVKELTRRERVTALVRARWPTPLSPNRFVNTILDIVRSHGTNISPTGEALSEDDVLEAVDALSEMHLGVSEDWKEAT